jgi:hypothetical protein
VTTKPDQPSIVRCKISRELAFPVGYELLRDHFSTSRYLSESCFCFAAHPTTFASEFARILRERERYCVLRLEHSTKALNPADQATHWHFTLYPVLRGLKSIARAALVGQSFAALQDFVARAPVHWNYYNRCDAVFDPVEGRCNWELLWEI